MRPKDPFPTVKMTVPHLADMLARLRDGDAKNSITIVRADSSDEGEWILGNAASRLMRSNIKHFGPEPMQVEAIIEHALRIGAKVALVGELRRFDDAKAVRAGASLGIRIAAFVNKPQHQDGREFLSSLGPWRNYDMAFFSREGPPRRPLF